MALAASLAACGSTTVASTTSTTSTTVPGDPTALGAPASVPESVLTVATPAVPGTPAKYDQVQVRRFGNPSASHVLVLVPGTNGGAGDFDLVAPYLATHVPDLQVWSEMRREGALQDESVVQSTLAGRTTPTQMFDYYLGWIADPAITHHYQPLKAADYPFVADWGMAVAMDDLHAVIVRAADGGRRTVTLGGHSLGGTEAAAYAAWDFAGTPGYRTINGIVCIDGCAGAPAAFGTPPTVPSAQAQVAAAVHQGPVARPAGVGLPWATGAFSEVGAVTAYKDPTGPATTFENFPLLPAAFKPPKPVTNEAQLGYAFDYKTSPPGLKLIQVHSGHVAATGDPAGWVDTGITPIRNVVDAFAQTPLAAAEWYYPERLSIDAGAAASLQQTDGRRPTSASACCTPSQVDVPLYAFQTALGGTNDAVAASARAYKAESKIPSVTVVSRTATYSHLDPLLASPGGNDFLKTVVPWLDRVDRLARTPTSIGGGSARPRRSATPARASPLDASRLPAPRVAPAPPWCCCGTATGPTSATRWRRWPASSPPGACSCWCRTGGPTTPRPERSSSWLDRLRPRQRRRARRRPGPVVLAGWSLGANAAAAVGAASGHRSTAGPVGRRRTGRAPTTGRRSTVTSSPTPGRTPAGRRRAGRRCSCTGPRTTSCRWTVGRGGRAPGRGSAGRSGCAAARHRPRRGHRHGLRPEPAAGACRPHDPVRLAVRTRWRTWWPRPPGRAVGGRRRPRVRSAARNRRTCPLTSSGLSRWRKWPAPSTTTISEPGARWSVTGPTMSTPMQPSSAPWR